MTPKHISYFCFICDWDKEKHAFILFQIKVYRKRGNMIEVHTYLNVEKRLRISNMRITFVIIKPYSFFSED